jgi:hypothetical protein
MPPRSAVFRLTLDTLKRLDELGRFKATYGIIISRLLDEHDKNRKKMRTYAQNGACVRAHTV